MSGDTSIHSRIEALVAEEHQLNSSGSGAEQHARRQRIEEELDQCWDLLRQRQARRHVGQNPDDAQARPVTEVESYLQ